MRYTHSFPLTRRHLGRGDAGDCWSCPLALSLADHGYDPLIKEEETYPYGYESCDDQRCDGSCDKCEGDCQPDHASVRNTADAATFVFQFDQGQPVRTGTVILSFDTEDPLWSRLHFVPDE